MNENPSQYIQETVYTHEYLWRSSSRLVELSAFDDLHSYNLLLPALLMSFMAFESFVNFCGIIARPDLWDDEKKNLKGKGVEGKLQLIVSTLKYFDWQKGTRPYQRIKTLEDFRDSIAHGKVIENKYTASPKEDGTHFSFRNKWDEYLTPAGVEGARRDIKDFSQSIIVEMRKTFEHSHLGFDAFEGPLASAEGTTKRQLT